jgi:hypothetical protein
MGQMRISVRLYAREEIESFAAFRVYSDKDLDYDEIKSKISMFDGFVDCFPENERSMVSLIGKDISPDMFTFVLVDYMDTLLYIDDM